MAAAEGCGFVPAALICDREEGPAAPARVEAAGTQAERIDGGRMPAKRWTSGKQAAAAESRLPRASTATENRLTQPNRGRYAAATATTRPTAPTKANPKQPADADELGRNVSRNFIAAGATDGTVSNIVYALTICRGDTNASACMCNCTGTIFQDETTMNRF
uniref:Uncharacterized protein n=1 Tax=Oryza brachyantha TaxID=4533 RepID=J3MRJ5_ORYBR